MTTASTNNSVSPWPDQVELACGPLTAVDLALFAAASGDHNPLHLDAEVARAAGFDKPLVHGMLTMALAGRLFTHHFGTGCVQRLQTRFVGVVKLGESLRLSATRSAPLQAGAAPPDPHTPIAPNSPNSPIAPFAPIAPIAHYTLQVRTANGTEVATGAATLAR
jgi:MaoC like domain